MNSTNLFDKMIFKNILSWYLWVPDMHTCRYLMRDRYHLNSVAASLCRRCIGLVQSALICAESGRNIVLSNAGDQGCVGDNRETPVVSPGGRRMRERQHIH